MGLAYILRAKVWRATEGVCIFPEIREDSNVTVWNFIDADDVFEQSNITTVNRLTRFYYDLT